MRRKGWLVAAVAALWSVAGSAADWVPPRPVRLVVPFAAGGPTDALARHLAEALRPRLNQTIVVDNRAGAGGNIGAAEVARAEPDGLTILFGTSGQLAINVSLYRTLAYDPVKSFEPVISIGDLPNVLTVHPKVPARTLQDLVAYAKAHPGELNYASSGNGATSHLAGVLFNETTGTKLRHVPYRGTGPALNDLVAGHVEMTFTDVLTAQPQIESGNIVPIGVTTRERSAALPKVPTLAEQGLKDFDVSVFFGLVVPKSTPPEVVRGLNKAFAEALADPQLKSVLDQQGIRPDPDRSPEGLRALIAREIPKWRAIVAASGAMLD